jgi:dTDP-4-dehydrorhamnose reductase
MSSTVLAHSPLEVWAGVECTVNRVGDRYFDQLDRNGHATRITDLDLFASLGIRAIRYPVLWERIAPNTLEQADWHWADQRLQRLRELNIRPIVGLVHHGSGPFHTSLVDPAFPEQLAEFAHAVAARYPWVDAYTPVNEPLTTARFSGLYGHWYPHGQDDPTFIRALLQQCRGIVLAMQAIRRVNPQAQLIQTEDLGKIFSTPLLKYQAEFENERRWLSFDLLCGRVDSCHPLWSYLCWIGIAPEELNWFSEHACLPDILGINRYLTSDRFLDERRDSYPAHTHGGNGRHSYADVEAVRVCLDGVSSAYTLLKEVWERYKLPIAITEVHLGCTREEQLRWLQEIWQDAQRLRAEAIDFRAVTAWSLLGAYDWNSLLTRLDNHYEPGVFDLRSPRPRSTALARMLQTLAQGQNYQHPVLQVPGWWRRADRLLYTPVRCGSTESIQPTDQSRSPVPPLVITGARGTLGRAFARLCEVRGIPYRLLSRQEMDITQPESVAKVLAELQPWAVINAAGYVRVDEAEREPDLCQQINATGAAILAKACAQLGVSFVTFSSDLVFDGSVTQPYVESSEVSPLNAYGHSKAIAERWVLDENPSALVIRTSAFFGPWDQYNFLSIMLNSLASGDRFMAAEDAIVSPTYVPDLVNATLDLLIDCESGIWHIANDGAISWADLARQVATLAGLDATRIEARPSDQLNWVAPRPTYSVLSSERGILLPSLERSVHTYLRDRVV